jgi:hypothetical protein
VRAPQVSTAAAARVRPSRAKPRAHARRGNMLLTSRQSARADICSSVTHLPQSQAAQHQKSAALHTCRPNPSASISRIPCTLNRQLATEIRAFLPTTCPNLRNQFSVKEAGRQLASRREKGRTVLQCQWESGLHRQERHGCEPLSSRSHMMPWDKHHKHLLNHPRFRICRELRSIL